MKARELTVQRQWDSLEPGSRFKSADNLEIEIISTGLWNHEAGPDFRDARIRIDNHVVTGDVEIHSRASDWFRHGHEPNPAYFNVILHVAEIDDLTGAQREQLPPLMLLTDSKKNDSAEKRTRSGKCRAILTGKSFEELSALLEDAGMARFREKSDIFVRQALLDGIEKCTLRAMFEAVGYKNNRENFIELFERYLEYDPHIREADYEAILWGESGLLPDPAVNPPVEELLKFESACWDRWWSIRLKARPEIQWRRDGLRPFNTPERRVAAAVMLIRRFGEHPLRYFVNLSMKVGSYKVFIEEMLAALALHDEIWDYWINFHKPKKSAAAILGRSRALELAVNVILPAMYAFGRLEKRKGVADFALAAWKELPAMQDNTVLRTVAAKWFGDGEPAAVLKKSAAAGQGAIQLYREFCRKCAGDCAGCRLLDSLH
jgi:hypothetical protein